MRSCACLINNLHIQIVEKINRYYLFILPKRNGAKESYLYPSLFAYPSIEWGMHFFLNFLNVCKYAGLEDGYIYEILYSFNICVDVSV